MVDLPGTEGQDLAGESAQPSVYSFEWFLRRYVESRFPSALRRMLAFQISCKVSFAW